MDSKKLFLKSKTLIGLLVSAAPAILGAFGFDLNAESATELGGVLGGLADNVEGIIQAGGLLLAAYGRIKATKPLTVKK